MKKLIYIFTFGCLLSLPFNSNAQYKTLILNYEKSALGDNEPLPAHKFFNITGVTTTNMGYIELAFYAAKGKRLKKPIYENFWKRDFSSQSTKFTIPIHYKLREGKSYDIIVRYFAQMGEGDKDSLKMRLQTLLNAYIDQSYTLAGTKIKFRKNAKKSIADLNEIVKTSTTQYRTRTMTSFTGFSNIVHSKFEQIKKFTGKNNVSKLLDDLKDIIYTELNQLLGQELYVLADDKLISNYPTERLQNYLPVNVGYGGALLSTDFDHFNYTASPYAGLSFPFGKEGSNSKFWSRTSFSVGVIINQNLTDQHQTTFTGPIFGIPLYGALGYRAFRFIRINAGVTVLEEVATDTIDIYPFIGISAELNLSLKLAKN